MITYNKITVGWVTQKYVTLNGKRICVGQEFFAGDQVDRETLDGETIFIDTDKEQYQPFDMKQPKSVEISGLEFVCSGCGSNRLECVMFGSHTSEVINIEEDGDFDYGEVDGSGEVERWQCLDCGMGLEDIEGESIIDDMDVVEWIKKNCSQK